MNKKMTAVVFAMALASPVMMAQIGMADGGSGGKSLEFEKGFCLPATTTPPAAASGGKNVLCSHVTHAAPHDRPGLGDAAGEAVVGADEAVELGLDQAVQGGQRLAGPRVVHTPGHDPGGELGLLDDVDQLGLETQRLVGLRALRALALGQHLVVGGVLQAVGPVGQGGGDQPGPGILAAGGRAEVLAQLVQQALGAGHGAVVHGDDHRIAAAEVRVDGLARGVTLSSQAADGEAEIAVAAVDTLCCIEKLPFLVHRTFYSWDWA